MYRINTKTICAVMLCIVTCLSMLTGCGRQQVSDIPTISLSIWSDERMVPLIEEGVEEFQSMYKDQVRIEYTISEEGEDTCRDTILADPDHAADIFSFADDQFDDLYNNGVLLEITEDGDEVLEASGGKESLVSQVVVRDGSLYAYPQTAGNGYFLYYNKAYFSDDDVQTLDGILDIAADNNKKFTMDFVNGWYIYSFFKGAGLKLSVNKEGTANVCDWNSTAGKYKGVDVVNSMLDIATDPGFVSLDDDSFVEGVKNGEVIAGINGAWNSSYVEEAWGDDYGAVKLPTYTINGDQVQMASFTGFKLMGVSAKTKNPEWSMRLAEYLTNKESQIKRFQALGECPVNTEAAASEDVKSNPAVSALAAQEPYATIQRIASPYWDASNILGITIAGGNSGKRDIQELLDETVSQIVSDSE